MVTIPISANIREASVFSPFSDPTGRRQIRASIDCHGVTNAEVVYQALEALVARHEVLRLRLHWDQGVQQILPRSWAAQRVWVGRSANNDDNLYEFDVQRHRIYFGGSPLVFDRVSTEMLRADLHGMLRSKVFAAAGRTDYTESCRALDHAVLTRRAEGEARFAAQWETGTLTAMPFPRTRGFLDLVGLQDTRQLQIRVSGEVLQRLMTRAVAARATMRMWTLAAIGLMLRSQSQDDRIILSVPLSYRGAYGIKAPVGNFTRRQVLLVDSGEAGTYDDFLRLFVSKCWDLLRRPMLPEWLTEAPARTCGYAISPATYCDVDFGRIHEPVQASDDSRPTRRGIHSFTDVLPNVNFAFPGIQVRVQERADEVSFLVSASSLECTDLEWENLGSSLEDSILKLSRNEERLKSNARQSTRMRGFSVDLAQTHHAFMDHPQCLSCHCELVRVGKIDPILAWVHADPTSVTEGELRIHAWQRLPYHNLPGFIVVRNETYSPDSWEAFQASLDSIQGPLVDFEPFYSLRFGLDDPLFSKWLRLTGEHWLFAVNTIGNAVRTATGASRDVRRILACGSMRDLLSLERE